MMDELLTQVETGGTDGLVDAASLASALGVSKQTILNWADPKVGMPVAMTTPHQRGPRRWFDVDVCRKWAMENRPSMYGGGPGGVRDGAGRPPEWRGKKGRPKGSKNRPKVAAQPLPLIEAGRAGESEFDEGKGVGSLRQGVAIAKLQVEIEQRRLSLEREKLELAKLRGETLMVDDVAQTWTGALGILRQRLTAAPDRVAGNVLAALGVSDPSRRFVVADAVREEIEKIMEEIGKGALVGQLGAA